MTTPWVAVVVMAILLIERADTSITDKVLLGFVKVDRTSEEALMVAAMACCVTRVADADVANVRAVVAAVVLVDVVVALGDVLGVVDVVEVVETVCQPRAVSTDAP